MAFPVIVIKNVITTLVIIWSSLLDNKQKANQKNKTNILSISHRMPHTHRFYGYFLRLTTERWRSTVRENVRNGVRRHLPTLTSNWCLLDSLLCKCWSRFFALFICNHTLQYLRVNTAMQSHLLTYLFFHWKSSMVEYFWLN